MARFLSSSQCYADMVLCTQAGRGHASLECFKEIYSANVNYLDVAKRMDAYYARVNAAREKAKAAEAAQ